GRLPSREPARRFFSQNVHPFKQMIENDLQMNAHFLQIPIDFSRKRRNNRGSTTGRSAALFACPPTHL
ncbi:hypothetical protein, partial [Clostridium sp. ATCC 29733]|uniref:hypothetical protein n=1 Tax=Clostridium sp. (strain ATCC 29733 / VPI C48-50) TaxID=1507 RepID=UPI001A98EBC4